MEVFAEGKNIRISPRKAKLVADNLAGKHASEALEVLKFVQKKASLPLAKVLKSAISNATNNNKLDEKKLIIKEVVVNEGPRLKRFLPRSRGMANPIIKRTSHIRVVVVEEGK
ncbi:50S ribosomal protein L22 [Patescibacteria group bacterium]|nr:50S ribosomal protein L22 [Patescibacteria group bacterium]